MSWMVYGILRGDSNAVAGPDPTGLVRVDAGGLAMACGPAPPTGTKVDADRALAFARVVESLHRRGPVLPARFGCLVDSLDEARGLLITRREEWAPSLAEVDGCEEMGLRVLLPGDGPPDRPMFDGAGASYLRGRRDLYRQIDAAGSATARIAARLDEDLRGLYRRCRPGPPALGPKGQPMTVSVAFLVPRGDLARFRDACGRLRTIPQTSAAPSGPWPPYSFASVSDEPKSDP